MDDSGIAPNTMNQAIPKNSGGLENGPISARGISGVGGKPNPFAEPQ